MMNRNILKSLMLAAFFLPWHTTAEAQSAESDIKQSAVVDLDSKYASSLLAVGTEAPEIVLSTLDGKEFSLSSLRGKYVVLDFWASWCPDCRKDAPNIKALYEKFHEKGVEFVGVSFDRNRDSWKTGVEKLGIPYTQVSDLKNMRDSEVAKTYHISWIPTVYVVNPQGNVVLATVMSDKVSAYLHSVYPDCAE